MRKPGFVLCFPLLFLLAPGSSPAQESGISPVLYSLTEQNGLSDNVITCFLQDSRHFMWIGTQDGLNLYNGSEMKIFRRTRDTSAELADNAIYAIAEDSLQNIWIATNNGLSRYSLAKGEMKSWKIEEGENRIDLNHIKTLAVDGSGKVWLGTAAGLAMYDPLVDRFRTYAVTDEEKGHFRRANNFVNQLLIDKKGRFWLATFTGLWRFSPSDGKFKKWLSEKDFKTENALIGHMLEDHLGRIWISIWNGGVKVFQPDSGIVRSVPELNHLQENVQGMAEINDGRGNYHLFISPQLNEFSPATLSVSSFLPQGPSKPGTMKIGSLYTSQDQLLWMATDDGVRIMDPSRQVFRHHILSDRPWSTQGMVAFENHGNFYVGGSGRNFLNLYDSAFQLVRRVLPGYHLHQEGRNPYPALLHITREDARHLWLSTEDGICYYDEATGDKKVYRIDASINSSPTANFFNGMLIDSRGDHWVFPWRNGIWKLDPRTGAFRKIFDGFMEEFGARKHLLIVDAVEDRLGNLWMADLDEGLVCFDYRTQAFSKPAEKVLGEKFQLQNVVFENPFVWVVTAGKILRMDVASRQWKIWPIPVTFNKSITGFCSDGGRHLWITTANGLLSFDKQTGGVKRYSTSDGLMENNLHGTILGTRSGRVIYAGEDFITEFDPALLDRPTLQAQPRITGVFSQNQPLHTQSATGGTREIQLNYASHDLTIHWALPNYSNPLQNQYYCQLQGVDRDWKYVGNRGEVQYASLQPGNYLFLAGAAAGNGWMSSQPDRIRIIIRPPVWRQWWFIAGALIMVSTLLYYAYRVRVGQLIRMERLRSRISSDLHDDIGSTLSSISILSDLAIEDAASGPPAVLREIRENSTSLMEKMDDIVWSINPRNDSLDNLLMRVKQFSSRLLEAKNIDYSIDVEGEMKDIRLPMEYRQHIYLILKEAINNLVKYSEATRASIEVSRLANHLRIRVADNGRGFEREGTGDGNGILNMKSRAALMKSDLSVRSFPGKGTIIELIVKIK